MASKNFDLSGIKIQYSEPKQQEPLCIYYCPFIAHGWATGSFLLEFFRKSAVSQQDWEAHILMLVIHDAPVFVPPEPRINVTS